MLTAIALLAGIALGATGVLLVQRRARQPRHRHTWDPVNTSQYDALGGPRTLVTVRCQECPRSGTWRVQGHWDVAELRELGTGVLTRT